MEDAIVVSDESKTLNDQERGELARCEATIDRGLRDFVEVGLALVKIRDERLYRQEYHDFNQYCRQRWGVSRIHAHCNIEAARVYEMLPIGNKPTNEAQVRPLTRIRTEDGKLDAKAITRVWRRVVDKAPVDSTGRKVFTAQFIEEATRPVLHRRRLSTCSRSRSRRSPLAIVSRDAQEDAAGDLQEVKESIPAEEFARLRKYVEQLDKLMRTETISESVRTVLENICQIVLD